MGNTSRTEPFRLGHRPALDGLRAVAFLLVLLHHIPGIMVHDAKGWFFSGGYVGVDLFFALSGFLITCVLLGEFERTGRVDVIRFIWRRALRLGPAMLGLVGFLYALALAGSGRNTPEFVFASARWTVLFGQNIQAPGHLLPETIHTWSLGVEGQFYLAWALATTVVLASFRRPRAALVVLALAAAAILPVIRIVQHEASSNFYASFMGPARIDGPLLGSVVGVAYASGWLERLSKRWVTRLTVLGLLALAAIVQWSSLNDNEFFRDLVAVTPYAVLCAVIVGGVALLPDGKLARALTFRPLAWLGTVSYSLYLWHLPVYIWMDRRAGDWPKLVEIPVALVLTFAAGVASYWMLERPFLRSRRQVRDPEPTTSSEPRDPDEAVLIPPAIILA